MTIMFFNSGTSSLPSLNLDCFLDNLSSTILCKVCIAIWLRIHGLWMFLVYLTLKDFLHSCGEQAFFETLKHGEETLFLFSSLEIIADHIVVSWKKSKFRCQSLTHSS